MKTQSFFVSKIQASIENLRITIEDVLAYFTNTFGDMGESTYLELKVVLNELLINAVKHGSKEDTTKFVKVVAGLIFDEFALIVVEDEGEGYDLAEIDLKHKAVIEARENDAKEIDITDIHESGRGVFLVKNLCEDYLVNNKGNRVVIYKKLSKTAL